MNYSYDNAWGDKLTAYDGAEIATDAIGNPLNMRSADVLGDAVNATLEWNGRTLLSATVDNNRYEYTYNHEGLRTKMVIRNKNTDAINAVYYYVWRDGKLTGYMITDENGVMEHNVKMLFDETGDSIGYELYAAEDNSTRAFLFLKNLQGDITAVFNEMGECILEYSYDAWGNIYADLAMNDYESIFASSEAIIYTPITYRGYVYDYYTGLYYLQSRYYNPLYGRFLNMDDTDILEKTVGGIHGANLFTYCNNNPVMNVDYTGEIPGIVVGIYFVSCMLFIVCFLIVALSLIWNLSTLVGNNAYENNGIIDSLKKIYETISKYKSMFMASLYASALLAANKMFNGNKVEHHIIAQNAPKAEPARLIYLFVGGDVQDDANKIKISTTFHEFLHADIYYISVNALISESYYFPGTLTREASVHSMLATLKLLISLTDKAMPASFWR